MPEHSFAPIEGSIERLAIDSDLLNNHLGDPTNREVMVHIPQQGLELIEQGGKLPVMIYLAPLLLRVWLEQDGKRLRNPCRKDMRDWSRMGKCHRQFLFYLTALPRLVETNLLTQKSWGNGALGCISR